MIYPDFPSSTRGKFEFGTANFDEKTNSEKDEFQKKTNFDKKRILTTIDS